MQAIETSKRYLQGKGLVFELRSTVSSKTFLIRSELDFSSNTKIISIRIRPFQFKDTNLLNFFLTQKVAKKIKATKEKLIIQQTNLQINFIKNRNFYHLIIYQKDFTDLRMV